MRDAVMLWEGAMISKLLSVFSLAGHGPALGVGHARHGSCFAECRDATIRRSVRSGLVGRRFSN